MGEHGGDRCIAEASLCLVHDEPARRPRMVTSRGRKGWARVKRTHGSRIFCLVWFGFETVSRVAQAGLELVTVRNKWLWSIYSMRYAYS